MAGPGLALRMERSMKMLPANRKPLNEAEGSLTPTQECVRGGGGLSGVWRQSGKDSHKILELFFEIQPRGRASALHPGWYYMVPSLFLQRDFAESCGVPATKLSPLRGAHLLPYCPRRQALITPFCWGKASLSSPFMSQTVVGAENWRCPSFQCNGLDAMVSAKASLDMAHLWYFARP